MVAAVHARLPGGSGGAAVVSCAAAATPHAERARPAVVVHDSLGQRHRHRDCLRKTATSLTWLVGGWMPSRDFARKELKIVLHRIEQKTATIPVPTPDSRVREGTGRFTDVL